MLVPVALYVRGQGHETLSLVLVFVACFFFFLFSTAPKIGFATLMQSLAAEADASGRIFGFVAAFLTATDSIVLMAFSAVFASTDLQLALWITCGCIALHGVVEVLVGPSLVLGALRVSGWRCRAWTGDAWCSMPLTWLLMRLHLHPILYFAFSLAAAPETSPDSLGLLNAQSRIGDD
jgi:hypothetical protein